MRPQRGVQKILNDFTTLPKLLYTETYSEPCQTSKIKLFAEILNCFQLLTIAFIFEILPLFIHMSIQNPVEHPRWSFL